MSEFPPPPPMPAEVAQRLAIVCPCGHAFQIGLSLCMQFGVNTGHAHCPACQTWLHCEVTTATEARCEPWAEYSARLATPPEVNCYVSCPEGGAT